MIWESNINRSRKDAGSRNGRPLSKAFQDKRHIHMVAAICMRNHAAIWNNSRQRVFDLSLMTVDILGEQRAECAITEEKVEILGENNHKDS